MFSHSLASVSYSCSSFPPTIPIMFSLQLIVWIVLHTVPQKKNKKEIHFFSSSKWRRRPGGPQSPTVTVWRIWNWSVRFSFDSEISRSMNADSKNSIYKVQKQLFRQHPVLAVRTPTSKSLPIVSLLRVSLLTSPTSCYSFFFSPLNSIYCRDTRVHMTTCIITKSSLVRNNK